jgi:hypothetical protein
VLQAVSMQCECSACTVPMHCPYSVSTVPIQCPCSYVQCYMQSPCSAHCPCIAHAATDSAHAVFPKHACLQCYNFHHGAANGGEPNSCLGTIKLGCFYYKCNCMASTSKPTTREEKFMYCCYKFIYTFTNFN